MHTPLILAFDRVHNHAYSHPCPCLIACTTHKYISGPWGGKITETQTHTCTHICALLLAQTHVHLGARSSFTITGAYPLQLRSVTPKLTYLFHPCGTSLLNINGCMAVCTVRHPSIQRPFSSLQIDVLCNYTFI